MPQFQRGPSPLPPNMSRPSSRTEQHQGHMRRVSSNLAPPQHQPPPMQQQNYAYTPNPPFYNPPAPAQMQRPPNVPPQPPPNATYPPPYPPPPGAQHPQMQHVMMQDNRRSSIPATFAPQPPAQPNMQRPQEQHLQPPQHPQRHPSPRPQQQGQPQRLTQSPQPPQQQFASPPLPQPKPLPAAKNHSIFTPIDDSRSMLARSWGSTSNAEPPRSDPNIRMEEGPRSQSIDVAAMQRDRPNGVSPRPPPARPGMRSPQPPQRTESAPGVPQIRPPTRSNTMGSDAAKRPRLKVQIPSEQSDGEGQSASAAQDGSSTSQPPPTGQPGQGPPAHGVVLPPPSPSAGALLSAGAQGPPNPFARPAPPMSTNPHAANRDAPTGFKDMETPISALPSRFMSDNLLPSPSSFYPEWGFGSGRSADGNMLPSPLNFQTPVVANGGGWGRSEPGEEKKRAAEEVGGGDEKRVRS